jgi:hypothetical protein
MKKVAVSFSVWSHPDLVRPCLEFMGIEIPQNLSDTYDLYEFAWRHIDEKGADDPQIIDFLEEWIKTHPQDARLLQEVEEGLSWNIQESDGYLFLNKFLEVSSEELLAGLPQEKVDLLRYCHGRIEVKGLFPILR